MRALQPPAMQSGTDGLANQSGEAALAGFRIPKDCQMAITEIGCRAHARRKIFDLHVANMCSPDAYKVPAKG